MLIFGIVQQIIRSMKPFEKRKKYKATVLLDKKFYKGKSLYELWYTQKGICSFIEWEKNAINYRKFQIHIQKVVFTWNGINH
jgi:hypothetical protein